jgi:cytochrome P450
MSTTTALTPAAAAPAAPIPGPPGHPLLGMAPALRRDLLGTLQASFARYGDVVAYRVGLARGPRRLERRIVAVYHPDDVRRVFADHAAFTRRTTSFRVLAELFGTNLVTADDTQWRRQKRLLQPLFTRAATNAYASLIEQEARVVAERVGDDHAGTIDGLRTSERYALRVLGRTLFKDDRCIDADTIAALERLVPVVSRQLHARATQRLRLRLHWPTLRNRRFGETRDALYATIERVLARRQDAHSAGHDGDTDDLLSKLRDARDPAGERPLSAQEVRDQALIFLLAGYTTTASAICATLHLLGRHPQIQERVASGGERLVRASVQEGLRLYPPSYVLGRRVGPDGAALAGHALPPGTDVLVSPWVTHRHPAFWSDPELFDPWRFVGEQERPLYAWFPFGGGSRACIGRHLALLESTLFVRALLDRWRLESHDARMSMRQLNSMRPTGSVRIGCRPR